MFERARRSPAPGAARAQARLVPAQELVDLLCPAGLSPASARRDWARRVLVHYHGDAAAHWPLLAWQGFGSQGVSAWRSAGEDHRATRAAGRVDPCWPHLLQSLLRSRPALRKAPHARALLVEAAADGTAAFTDAALVRGRLQTLRRHRLEAPWHQTLLQQLQDEPQDAGKGDQVTAAWVHGGAGERDLAALAGAGLDAQASAGDQAQARPPWPQDFNRPHARPGPLAWVALAGGVCLLLAAGWGLQQAWQQREAAAAMAVPAVPKPRPTLAEPLPAGVLQRLNHPWREVFLAAERPAVAGLSWLALEHQAGGELRLQGVARTPEAVQAAAAALRMQPPWQRVLVARLEAEDAGLAFELTARGPGFKP